MNKIDQLFFKELEVPERINTFYYKGKKYSREELLKIQNKLNENISINTKI